MKRIYLAINIGNDLCIEQKVYNYFVYVIFCLTFAMNFNLINSKIMKKLIYLLFAFVAVVGFNVYAEGNESIPPEEPIGTDDAKPYACWWSEKDKDCKDAGSVGCICVK